MKRSIVGALLGLAVATSALGQGHILVSNYVLPDYNQIYWNPDAGKAPAGRANQAVNAADGLTFQVFYALGNISDPAAVNLPGLTFGVNDLFSYDPGMGHGGGGYFVNVDQMFSGWTAGSTVTLKFSVITEGFVGESPLWTERDNIVIPAASPNSAYGTPTMMVSIIPEPSTFAMLGLGAAALLIFRRRS